MGNIFDKDKTFQTPDHHMISYKKINENYSTLDSDMKLILNVYTNHIQILRKNITIRDKNFPNLKFSKTGLFMKIGYDKNTTDEYLTQLDRIFNNYSIANRSIKNTKKIHYSENFYKISDENLIIYLTENFTFDEGIYDEYSNPSVNRNYPTTYKFENKQIKIIFEVHISIVKDEKGIKNSMTLIPVMFSN